MADQQRKEEKMEQKNKIIVNFTPTGMLPGKADSLYVPISPVDIIAEVREACDLGITMVHLHAREDGEPAYSKEIYGEIIGGIREFSKELIICVSTSGRVFSEIEKRGEVLDLQGELKPDMASLTLSSLNFNKQASLNDPETINRLLAKMNKNNIKPELEAFDPGMLNYAKYLIKKGFLKPPYYFNLILGNIACAQANLLHLGLMLNDLPENSYCSVGGIGDAQLKMNSVAIAIGLGVRTGLEDNLWYDKNRTRLAKNLELLQRIHRIINENEKTVMKPEELRLILDLKRDAE